MYVKGGQDGKTTNQCLGLALRVSSGWTLNYMFLVFFVFDKNVQCESPIIFVLVYICILLLRVTLFGTG